MMSAQGTPNSPAGNFFGRMPGITTHAPGRGRGLDHLGAGTSRIGVDAVSTTPAPMTASRSTTHALDDDAARADEAAVLDDHRPRAGRLEHAADADAAGQVQSCRSARSCPTVAHVSTIVPAPTRAPMFT